METEVFLGVILAALSGLYFAIYKNHGCIKRIETDMKYIKESMSKSNG